MLDTGLLLSGAAAVAAMWLAARVMALPWAPGDVLDRLLLPGIVGLLAGRVAAVLLDDPTSIGSLRAFLVIRGGVELWPGAVAAAAALAISLRRAGEPVTASVAALAPVVIVGYGAYEASCLLREACYGPHAAVGLRPDGLSEPMVPLGVVVGAAIVGVAAVLARREPTPLLTVASATLAVAAARSAASVWLPRIGDGLTRPHRESLAVAALAAVAGAVLVVRERRPLA
jgi:prolipoprotein diacylglyceryltransferase